MSSRRLKTIKKRDEPEYREQCCVVTFWERAYPKLRLALVASCNGAALSGGKLARIKQWARLQKSGAKKGESDLFISVPKGKYHGLYIEMKADGKTQCSVSDDQWKIIEDRRSRGYYAEWCAGADEAIELIKNYMKLEDVSD